MSLSHSYPYNTEISSRPEIAGPVSGGKKEEAKGWKLFKCFSRSPTRWR